MIPGFSGRLISESFLEQHLDQKVRPSALDRNELSEWRRRTLRLGPASSLRSILETSAAPLARTLGFSSVADIVHVKDSVAATFESPSARVTVIVTGWGERLDPFWRTAVGQAHERGTPWCVLFNGTHVRVVEARRLYARRFSEIDLDLAADHERTHAVLCTLLGADAYAIGPNGTDTGLHVLLNASERHASAVCRSLRAGVLQASADVLGALASGGRRNNSDGQRSLGTVYEQALTVVYRILFLLFAEARNLVPLWHPVYRESYSIDAIRAAAEHPSTSVGLWDALRAVSRLAHAGCRAGDLRVTPFNGRLFAPSRAPLADRRDLDDAIARRVVLALATRPAPDRSGRERIAYRDLGVEQLGAVYETLLDYAPRPAADSRSSEQGRPTRVVLEPGSHIRKETGTFYTPQPIAEYLVRRTLEPLVRDVTPERILELKILDPAMGSGAFLIAACRYLAHSYELVLVRAGGCHASDLGPREQATIRRTIAERCLYGVDVNPMAVQLARLSLWLATLAADRPLSFLDHHLQTGDSLIGAWLASLKRPPTGRRRSPPSAVLPLFDDTAFSDVLRQAIPVRFSLAVAPSDTLDDVRAKERALAGLKGRDTSLSKWKRIADLWCARWFSAPDEIPISAFGALSDVILGGQGGLPTSLSERYLAVSETIAHQRRFVHWELDFPEVFFADSGERLSSPGFDAVLGNPPWDMVRADAGTPEERSGARRDVNAVVRFTRDSGMYSGQSDGHANRYQLFVERAIDLLRSGGRMGFVLPSGMTSDHGSARLRRVLFSRCAVDGIVSFTNRDGVFPIHRSVRFLLLTCSQGSPTTEFGCRLGERNPAVLEEDPGRAVTDDWFTVRVSPALLEQISGPDLSLPELRSPLDLQITERAAALFPPLASKEGWGAGFGRELNATEDAEYFKDIPRGLPVLEGKHLEPFRARVESVRWRIAARDAARLLGERPQHPRLGYRDVASSTNRVTLIAAILPPRTVSTHTIFCLRTSLSRRDQEILCGLFNSYVVNFLVRLRVTTHVTTAIVERLPLPTRRHAPAGCREIAAWSRQLARMSDPVAFARLNARVAQIYQLTRAEFQHILDTFPLIPAEHRAIAMREFIREDTPP